MGRHEAYDVVVIGSGSAGFSAAFAARALGASVCVIEKGVLGGECPNEACIPTKALLRAARVHALAREAKRFGLRDRVRPVVFSGLQEYARQASRTVTGGGNKGNRFLRLAKRQGITIRFGSGTFVDTNTVQVDGGTLEGKAFVIATGSTDFIPTIPGLSQVPHILWRDVIHLRDLPKTLAIIGGGYVGTEFATLFGLLGVPVTLIQKPLHILEHEDAEIASVAEASLQTIGVHTLTDTFVTEVDRSHGHIRLTLDKGGDELRAVSRSLMMATGKRADTDGLGLDVLGVQLTRQGEVHVTSEQRSNVSYVFAAGDVDDGSARLTHTAHAEGVVAGHNAACVALKKRGGRKKVDMRVVPRVTFLAQEFASVGQTAASIAEEKGSVLVGRHNQASLGRSITDGGNGGMIKLVADPIKRTLLGGTIYGPHAGEMIHEIALAVHLGVKIDVLGEMIRAFPTYSEGITVAAHSARIE